MGFENRRNVLITFSLKQATIVSDELVCIFKTDAAFQKPLLLLCRISATNKALEELQNEAP